MPISTTQTQTSSVASSLCAALACSYMSNDNMTKMIARAAYDLGWRYAMDSETGDETVLTIDRPDQDETFERWFANLKRPSLPAFCTPCEKCGDSVNVLGVTCGEVRRGEPERDGRPAARFARRGARRMESLRDMRDRLHSARDGSHRRDQRAAPAATCRRSARTRAPAPRDDGWSAGRRRYAGRLSAHHGRAARQGARRRHGVSVGYKCDTDGKILDGECTAQIVKEDDGLGVADLGNASPHAAWEDRGDE